MAYPPSEWCRINIAADNSERRMLVLRVAGFHPLLAVHPLRQTCKGFQPRGVLRGFLYRPDG